MWFSVSVRSASELDLLLLQRRGCFPDAMVTRRRALARTRPPPAGASQSLTTRAPPLPWPAPPPNGPGPRPAGLDPAPCLPDPPPVGRAHPAPLNAKTGPGSSAFCRWNPASWASNPHCRWAPAEAGGVWREVSGSTCCPQAERDLLCLCRACRPPPQKTHQACSLCHLLILAAPRLREPTVQPRGVSGPRSAVSDLKYW